MQDNNTLQAQLLRRDECIGPNKPRVVAGPYGTPSIETSFENQQPDPFGMIAGMAGDPISNISTKPGGMLGTLLGGKTQTFESEPDMRLIKYLLDQGFTGVASAANRAWRNYTGHNIIPSPEAVGNWLTNKLQQR